MGTGEIFALSCAVVWAVAVIFFKRAGDVVPAFHLNLFKNVLASAAFLITILVVGRGQLLGFDFTGKELWLLAASGVVGIAIADVMMLRSLQLLGAGRIAVVDCLYTPFMMLSAMLILSENVPPVVWVGGSLVVAAVLVAGLEQHPGEDRRGQILGVVYGAGSMLLMSVFIVLVKPIMSGDTSRLFALTAVRLWVATVVGFVWLLLRGRMKELRLFFRKGLPWKDLILGSLLGAYLGMGLWIAGLAYSPNETTAAAVLNQSSVLFIVVLAVLFLGEQLTLRRVIGILLGFAGIVITIVGQALAK